MMMRDTKFAERIVLSGLQSIDIAYSVATALNTLHAKKISHRDIKCANIMVNIYFHSNN